MGRIYYTSRPAICQGRDTLSYQVFGEELIDLAEGRVKNNLQIISSLLDLQWRNWETKTPEDLIKDCQDRVRAIAATTVFPAQSSFDKETVYGKGHDSGGGR